SLTACDRTPSLQVSRLSVSSSWCRWHASFILHTPKRPVKEPLRNLDATGLHPAVADAVRNGGGSRKHSSAETCASGVSSQGRHFPRGHSASGHSATSLLRLAANVDGSGQI